MASKEYRVIKSFDSPKGVLPTGTIVTFKDEDLANHHLKFGYVEPASFVAPKKRVPEALQEQYLSSDFKASEAIEKLKAMDIKEARNFADADTRKGVKKALKEHLNSLSEKNKA